MGGVCGSEQQTADGNASHRREAGTMDTVDLAKEKEDVESSSDSVAYDPSDAINANVCCPMIFTFVLCVAI